MTPIVMLGKEIFQPASKELLKQLKKLGAKVIPKKEVTPAVKAKAKTVTKKNIVGLESDKYSEMIRKIPEGVGGKVRTLTEAERKGMPIETYTHGGPRGTASRPRPKPIPRLGGTPVGGKATAGKSKGALGQAKELKQRPKVRKDGGQVVKKDQQVAAAWMKGLSQKEIKQILGAPTTDSSGVTRHSKKKKTKKPTKVRKAKVGGKVVTYRMTGGQVVDAGYD